MQLYLIVAHIVIYVFACHVIGIMLIDEKYKIKVNRLPCGFVEVTCHNCRESQRVMNKIDCWLAVHGSDK